MRRRDVVMFLGGATAWVATARAQEPRQTIGVLGSAFYGAEPAFIQGLKDSGFIEGKNISIEWRWAEGQHDRLPSLESTKVELVINLKTAKAAASRCHSRCLRALTR